MDRRFIIKPSLILTTAAAVLWGSLFAQDESAAPVVIVSPSAWTTLWTDSLTVSVQADTSRLPRKSIDFKVVKRSGSRSSALFTKNVKMDDISVDAFIGKVWETPLGGADFLSLEWSVPGSDLKGVVEPIGAVKPSGKVSDDNKWVPAHQSLFAMRLKDGVAGDQAATALAEASGFEVGGYKFAAGWNKEGFFILFTPEAGMTGVEFAFDMKCGKNAFLAWADRFIVYTVDGDGLKGMHSGSRSVVDKEGLKFTDREWGAGADGSLTLTKIEAARLVSVQWPDLGVQPFDERNMGFSMFVKGKAKKQPPAYPANAKRDIPGTWGDLKLEK